MAVVIGAVLLSQIDHEFRVTNKLASPAVSGRYRTDLDRFDCLTRLAHRDIPKGAYVFPDAQGANHQLMGEILVGWAVLTSSADARWTVEFTSPGPCGATGIEAVQK